MAKGKAIKGIDFKSFPGVVAVVGSRSFADDPKGDMSLYDEVKRFVTKLPKNTMIVSGGARGIDKYAEDVAYVRGMDKEIFEPDEILPSPARFHERNRRLAEFVADNEGIIVAFMDRNSASGTQSTLRYAKMFNVPVVEFIYTQKGTFVEATVPDQYTGDSSNG